MRIGIVGTVFDKTFGITVEYGAYFEKLGEVVVLSPSQMIELDLVVIPGGADVDTQRYGERPAFFTSKPNPFFEEFDTRTLPKYIERGVPVFGICRGLQTLNVHFGGTLHQHLDIHPYSSHREERCHKIISVGEKRNKYSVNSMHHQAVKKLGDGLIRTFVSEKDNLVEAFEHETLKVAAVQWHPEEIRDIAAKNIIERLLSR